MKITGVSRCLVISVLVIICLYCSLGFASQLTSESNVYYRTEYMKIPVNIDGKDCELEAKIFRPIDDEPHPLIIMTHGRHGYTPSKNPKEVERFNETGLMFAKKKYIALTVVRRGYGNSSGSDAEATNSYAASMEAAKDLRATVEYMQKQSYVINDKIVVSGHSGGGAGTMAAASLNIQGVIGYINFAGFPVTVQNNQTEINNMFAKYGKTAKTPTLWLYSSGDQFLKYVDIQSARDSYIKAGGRCTLVLTKFVENGHNNFVTRIQDWLPYVDKYFDEIGM